MGQGKVLWAVFPAYPSGLDVIYVYRFFMQDEVNELPANEAIPMLGFVQIFD